MRASTTMPTIITYWFKTVEVSGLIDLGDMVYSALVNNVAIACTYAMLNTEDPLQAASWVIQGYHGAFPLTEQETDLIYYLRGCEALYQRNTVGLAGVARLCQRPSLCNRTGRLVAAESTDPDKPAEGCRYFPEGLWQAPAYQCRRRLQPVTAGKGKHSSAQT